MGTGTPARNPRPQPPARNQRSDPLSEVPSVSSQLGYRQVLELVREQAQLLGREPPQVLGAAKRQPLAALRRALAEGLEHIGESYLEEGMQHKQALAGEEGGPAWHFIGRLQSRRASEVARHFDWVQSLDRAKLVPRLDQARGEAGLPPLQVLLQVNLAGEETKGGAEPGQLDELAAAVESAPNLRLRGLMALPPLTGSSAQKAGWAALARELLGALAARHPDMDVLSVGTSDDWREAMAEGATMLRLGTSLFGERPA